MALKLTVKQFNNKLSYIYLFTIFHLPCENPREGFKNALSIWNFKGMLGY